MTSVSPCDLETESIVSASLINTLRLGTRIKLAVDELGGEMISAKVTAIGAAVDPVSKTIKVIAAFQQRLEGVQPGMAIVLAQWRASLKERQTGIRREIAELDVTAPFGGRIVQMVPNLHVGRWIGIEQPVLVVNADSDARVRGLVDANNVWRLSQGQRGRFIPNDITLTSLSVEVTSIAMADAPPSISGNWSPIAGRASPHGWIRTRRGVRAGPAPRPRANSRRSPRGLFRQDGGRCDHRRWRARNPAEAKLAPDTQGARA
jgi:hypothetical protein